MPNVTLQILPFHRASHVAAAGPITILHFAEPELADFVYMEELTSAMYLDRREGVDHYWALMNRLCVQAERPAPTIAAFKAIMTNL